MTDHLTPFERFRGKRGLVMGLGVFGGGVDSARFLARYCDRVVVTDLRDEGVLADSLTALRESPDAAKFVFRLGDHAEQDFKDADVVIHSPAVRPDNALLKLARGHGAETTMEMSLFIEACPAKTVGVTGSNGKTTTVLLCYEMLCEVFRRAQPELEGRWADPVAAAPTDGPRVWLGGNIGQPLLNRLPDIGADDVVVLELSSFQLHDWHRIKRSCEIAAITNITPNHLDWHEDVDEYIRDKCAIFDYQGKDGVVLLNAADEVCSQLVEFVPKRAVPFMARGPRRLSKDYSVGLLAMPDMVMFSDRERFAMTAPPDGSPMPTRSDLSMPGAFNWENAMVAMGLVALAARERISVDRMSAAMRRFRGVEHRLEFCGTVNGAQCYNDSIATTPESTIAALSAFDAPLHLILGGSDKGLSYGALADEIAEYPEMILIYLQGANTPALEAALREKGLNPVLYDTFDAACRSAFEEAEDGEIILMSPASASFYEHKPGEKFRNFEHRGSYFKQLVASHA